MINKFTISDKGKFVISEGGCFSYAPPSSYGPLTEAEDRLIAAKKEYDEALAQYEAVHKKIQEESEAWFKEHPNYWDEFVTKKKES